MVSLTEVESVIRYDMKDLPGRMTLQAKFKWLSSCCLVHEVLFIKVSNSSVMRFSLSSGSLASILIVSNVIPRYSKHCVGPTVLCGAIGILRLLNT